LYNIFVQPFKSQRDNYLETVTILAALFAYTLAFTLSIGELGMIFYFIYFSPFLLLVIKATSVLLVQTIFIQLFLNTSISGISHLFCMIC
jgi:hypothetical protein